MNWCGDLNCNHTFSAYLKSSDTVFILAGSIS